MRDLSVIITARNEEFLSRTVEDVIAIAHSLYKRSKKLLITKASKKIRIFLNLNGI